MLNDIKPPPMDPDAKPHPMHERPHVDRKSPGLHHARVMGEPTQTDTIYSMPLEDRGSGFSIGLSVVVIVLMAVLLVSVWAALG
jgi:hypothetical protein